MYEMHDLSEHGHTRNSCPRFRSARQRIEKCARPKRSEELRTCAQRKALMCPSLSLRIALVPSSVLSHSLFLAFIAMLSSVSVMSNILVLNVLDNLSGEMCFLQYSANIVDVCPARNISLRTIDVLVTVIAMVPNELLQSRQVDC